MKRVAIIFGSMLVGDVLAALTIGEIAHGHGIAAGAFDAGRDVCTVLCGGEAAAAIIKDGWNWTTGAAFAALMVASLLGTTVGVQIAARLG